MTGEPMTVSNYPYAINDGNITLRVRHGSPLHTKHPDAQPGETIHYQGHDWDVIAYNPTPGPLVDDTAPGQPPAPVNPLLNGRVS